MKIKRRWKILMTAMTLIAVAGVFVGEPTFECDWSVISAADVAWLITATIFVLMMTPGLSFFYGGMVGAKNVISTMLQSFIAMGLISVLWVVVGFSLCFGDDIGGVIGNPLSFRKDLLPARGFCDFPLPPSGHRHSVCLYLRHELVRLQADRPADPHACLCLQREGWSRLLTARRALRTGPYRRARTG